MKSSIYITSCNLKEVLILFDSNLELKDLILGDTLHPSSGFIDEKILQNNTSISGLLGFNYDFKGLVEFEAIISSMKIELLSYEKNLLEFKIIGAAKDIEVLKNRVIEANAYEPDKYALSFHIEYP